MAESKVGNTGRSGGPTLEWGRLGLVLALLLASPVLAAAADKEPPKPPDAYYASTFGQADDDFYVAHHWSKGGLFRSETIVGGHPIVTLVKGDEYYTLDLLTRKGVMVKRDARAVAQDAKRLRPFANELDEITALGGEKIRTEKVHGVECEVYRVTDETGRRTVWVAPGPMKLPLRVETFKRDQARTGTLDYTNWLPGLAAPDAFFDAPTGLDIKRFDSYDDYLTALKAGPVPPAPPLFGELLHTRGK